MVTTSKAKRAKLSTPKKTTQVIALKPTATYAGTGDIVEAIAASLACTFEYRTDDLVQNVSPHPARTDLPIFGRVIRVTDDSLVVHRCRVDGSLLTDAGVVGGPKVDFILKAVARLADREVGLGVVSRVCLLDYIDDPERLAAVTSSDDFTYISSAYAGLPQSPLANPYAVKGVTRPEAREKFADGLSATAGRNSPAWHELWRLAERIKSGKNVELGCWCRDDQDCHGDVIARQVSRLAA